MIGLLGDFFQKVWKKEGVEEQVYFLLYKQSPSELDQEMDEETKMRRAGEIAKEVMLELKRRGGSRMMTCIEMTELIETILQGEFYDYVKQNPNIGKLMLPDLPESFW